MLIIRAVLEHDDAIVGTRAAVAQLRDLRLDVHRITVEQGLGETHDVPAKVGDRRAERRVADRDSDHETEREGAVDDALAELGLRPAVLLIEVQGGGIVREGREKNIVGLRNGAADGVPEKHAEGEFFEIQSGHLRPPAWSRGMIDQYTSV